MLMILLPIEEWFAADMIWSCDPEQMAFWKISRLDLSGKNTPLEIELTMIPKRGPASVVQLSCWSAQE